MALLRLWMFPGGIPGPTRTTAQLPVAHVHMALLSPSISVPIPYGIKPLG